MKKYILNISLLVFVCSGVTKAQDFHLSQYDVSTMYYNPALTGMYGSDKGDYRIYVDNRSQWRSLGVKPFYTTYLGYDMPYTVKDKKIGLGAYFINNRTGPGNFNTTQFLISGAYNILDKKADGIHYLTCGLQMGIFYKTFNTSKLTYDVQYAPTLDGGSFDQNIASNEAYNNMNILKFDANLGLFYKFLDKDEKVHPFIGYSMSHLNRANESFTGDVSRIPLRHMVNGGVDWTIVDNKFDITPRFVYLNQGKSYDATLGILMYYKLSSNYSVEATNVKLIAGFDWRAKDAVIFHLGLKDDSWMIRMSYDVNNSYINTFTKGRGAWELSLIFTGVKGKGFSKIVPKF